MGNVVNALNKVVDDRLIQVTLKVFQLLILKVFHLLFLKMNIKWKRQSRDKSPSLHCIKTDQAQAKYLLNSLQFKSKYMSKNKVECATCDQKDKNLCNIFFLLSCK